MSVDTFTSAVLRPEQAAEYIGVSIRHLYTLYDSDPAFPKKITFSSRCVGFRRASIDAWLEQKEAQL